MAAKEGDWLPGAREGRRSGKHSQGKTGWVRRGGYWVQVRGGKPTGKKKKYATDTNLVAGTINLAGRMSKFALKHNPVTGIPAQMIDAKIRNRNKKAKTKPTTKTTPKTEIKTKPKTTPTTETKPTTKPTPKTKTKTKRTIEFSEPLSSKPKTKTKKSAKLKMHSIEKRNREIHGDAAIDALKEKHRKWKAARRK